jgi:hypothetical protein
LASQHTQAFVWQQARSEQESLEFADGNPMRGFLIGLAISAVLWATVGGGIWLVLPSAA